MQVVSSGPEPFDRGGWKEHLRTADLSAGVYTLKAGGFDPQALHDEDELYVCTAGRGTLWTQTATTPIEPGVAVFVPAGEEHRFIDITEDLTLVAAFAPGEETRKDAEYWPDFEALAASEEVEVPSEHADGTPFSVPIWMVRYEDALYARSFRGSQAAWYRNAVETKWVRLSAGPVSRLAFVLPVGDFLCEEIDAAYRTKYAQYAENYLPPMLTDEIVATTLRLTPR